MLYTTLADLPLNHSAIIQNLTSDRELRRRLMDLGFSPGTLVTPLFCSPFRDPIAYRVFGSVIALRKSVAEQIEITFFVEEEL